MFILPSFPSLSFVAYFLPFLFLLFILLIFCLLLLFPSLFFSLYFSFPPSHFVFYFPLNFLFFSFVFFLPSSFLFSFLSISPFTSSPCVSISNISNMTFVPINQILPSALFLYSNLKSIHFLAPALNFVFVPFNIPFLIF